MATNCQNSATSATESGKDIKNKKGKKEGDTVKREQLMWNPSMDTLFIQAMLNQQYEGNRVDGTFTSLAYANMVNELQQKLNISFTKAHLKNRLKTLKEHFSQCYDLFRGVGLSGFSWNPETKLFEAADEEIWEQLIAAKPDAGKWKTKQIFNYNELHELFAKDRATGSAAETAKEKNRRRSSTGTSIGGWESIQEIDSLLSGNIINLDSIGNDNEVQFVAATPSPQEQLKVAIESKGRKRKYEDDEEIKDRKKKTENENDMNSKIMASLENVANAIREGHTILQESNVILERSRQRVYTEQEIYNELEVIGLDSSEICEAYLFLVKQPENVRAIFGCPRQMRKKILEEMMKKKD